MGVHQAVVPNSIYRIPLHLFREVLFDLVPPVMPRARSRYMRQNPFEYGPQRSHRLTSVGYLEQQRKPAHLVVEIGGMVGAGGGVNTPLPQRTCAGPVGVEPVSVDVTKLPQNPRRGRGLRRRKSRVKFDDQAILPGRRAQLVIRV